MAKELNVGTATIVEYLLNNGFEVENKPSLVITDEMYENLLKEFKNSIAIKEQAEKLISGHRPSAEPKAGHLQDDDDIPVFRSGVAKEKITPTVPPPSPVVTPPKEDIKERLVLSEEQKPKIKVVGKIDLNQKKKAPQDEQVVPEEQEELPGEQQRPDPFISCRK